MNTTKKDEKNDDAEETERLLLEELARREQQQQQQQNKEKTSSSSSSSLLLAASGANKVVSATFSAFNETLNTILDTTREQEEEDKFWESVPVLPPLKEGEEYDEDDDGRRTSSQEEGVLLYSGEDDAYINHHNMRREKNAMLLGEEEYDEDDEVGRSNNNSQSVIITGGGGGSGGNFVADLLVNTYKQAQEAEEMLERRKRENVLNELDNWTTTTRATTNRVLDFDNMDDTNTEEDEKNHNNKNANNSAKMNADVRVGLTERYSSYLAKVLPIKSTKRRKNNGINDGKLIDGDGDDDDDDKRFEKIKSTFMSDEAQRELDKLEASFTPQRKSKKSFFRDFLQFGNNGSQNNAKSTQRGGGGELLLEDPALIAAVSKEMSKIDKVLNDLKTDVAIKNLANVARNTGGGRLNYFADALDALARHPMWEYQIVRNVVMIALLALFTFGIYLKISIESREEVGGLIDVGIQKSSRLGRRKFTGR